MALTVYRFATGRELWKLGFPGGNLTPADRRFQPGQVGAVTRSPNTAGKGQLKVSGLPTDTFAVRIEIMAEGNLGVATFRDSLDGGTTWELTKTVPADVVGEIDLPDDAPMPAWTASARCEGCAVRRGLMEPRPAPEDTPPEEP